MNNSIHDHEKLKDNSNALNNAMIDMQAFVTLAPKVFSKDADTLSDFQNDRDYFEYICTGIIANVARVKEIIPTKKGGTEIS